MSKIKKIKKVLITLFWVGVAGGLAVLLIAAMRIRDNKICSGILVEFKNAANVRFADKSDIIGMVKHAVPDYAGKPVKDFNLKALEQTLETNVWIKDAEVYFDNNEKLRVVVYERQPIARIISLNGRHFYIDEDFVKLPLSSRVAPRVPVFTSLPLDNSRWSKADSALLGHMKSLIDYLEKNEFWNAEINQIDYNQQLFELYVKTGKHTIVLGDGNNLPAKFDKLKTFYNEVLRKEGWDLYAKINVQFNGQVVATRNEGIAPVHQRIKENILVSHN